MAAFEKEDSITITWKYLKFWFLDKKKFDIFGGISNHPPRNQAKKVVFFLFANLKSKKDSLNCDCDFYLHVSSNQN